MLPCLFDPKQHEILTPELMNFCKRVAPAEEKDRLFCYHHKIHQTFVIARWAQDQAFGIFTDFLNMGHSLSNFDEEMAEEFRKRMFTPLTAKKMRRIISKAESNYKSMRAEEDAEDEESNLQGLEV